MEAARPLALFDTHAHYLDERFDEDRQAVLSALPGRGVYAVLEAACEAADIGKIRALTHMYPHVWGGAGVHPHHAEQLTDDVCRAIERALLDDEKIVALGEIGLDYHYDFSPRALQKTVFDRQLALAARLKRPVLIHDREAHGDMLELLRPYKGRLTGVMHCFSGSYETAVQCIDIGLHIGFGGALTFHNASRLRDVAARLPLERLLIETDCPYMTPVPHRGKRNDSSLMHLTLEALALARGAAAEAIAQATAENAERLFWREAENR